MNREHIEIDAIDYLKYKLKVSNRITPNFKEKDKEPSWDGDIFLSNNTLQGKLGNYIPVQIKGTKVKEFSGNTISHPVDVNDLINYREHHGVIFFVVQMKTRTRGKIYCEFLLPSDVSQYLSGKEKQKTVSIRLKAWDVSSARNIEHSLETFAIEANKQNNRTLYTEDLSKLSSFTVPAMLVQDIDFARKLIGKEIYLHGETYENNRRIELATRVSISGIVEHMNLTVTVGDMVFYSIVNETYDLSTKIIEIGTGFRFAFGDSTFYFKDTGTLNERILNYEFLRAVVEVGGFNIGDFKVSDVKPNFDMNEANENLLRLRETRDFFDFIGVHDDFYLNKIPNEQADVLNQLIIIKQGKVKHKGEELGMFKVNVQDKKYLVYLSKNSDGFVELSNPFSNEFNANIVHYSSTDDNIQFDGISYFLAIGDDYINECSNVNYSIIEKSLLSSTLNETVFPRYNGFCLKLIERFDINADLEALSCAISSLKRIVDVFEGETKVLGTVNLYQCCSRLRELTEDETCHLIEIKEFEKLKTEPSKNMLWAINVLLQSRAESKIEWSKLTEDMKNELSQYTIYNLYTKLIG